MRTLLASSFLLFASCNGDPPDTGNGNGQDTDTDDPIDCAPEDERLFWRDADGDGYGLGDESVRACRAPEGYADQAGDCNDADPTVYPGAPDDQCNGVDNNCDDIPDSDTEQVTRYGDRDGDGWGLEDQLSTGCLPSEGWAPRAGDCDDDDPDVNPGATEACDGKDTDCNGTPNDGLWGAGELCPADSCRDLHDLLPDSASGTYWLTDDAGSFQAQCRMDRTGGWTRITATLLRERGWVGFRATDGPEADDWVGRWDGDVMELVPRRRSSVRDCSTVVIRAQAALPFTFSRWEGDFFGAAVVNDTDAPAWGTAFTGGSPPCRGAVLFGNGAEAVVKAGGEWGFAFSESAVVTWSNLELPRVRSSITWEINDYNDGSSRRASLRVSDIDMWVH